MSVDRPVAVKRPLWQRFLICIGLIIWAVVVIVFLLGVLATFPSIAESPFHLVFGWVPFLWRSLSEMAMRWEMIVSGLVALAVAMAVLHVAARWVMASISGSGIWTVKSTAAVTVGMVVLFAASFVGTGIGHQMLWLGQEELTKDRSSSIPTMMANNARQLVFAARVYADDHEGQFPNTLEELAPDIIFSEDLERLMFFRTSSSRETEPWVYLGAGMSTDMPSHLPLIVSPRPIGQKSRYIVALVDGTTQPVDQPTYHQLMDEWRKVMTAKTAK